MSNKGLISIIMNCHNGAAYLKEALESVIKQKYKKWELIFWDNDSTDNSAKIFKSFKDKRLKYFFKKKKGKLVRVQKFGYCKNSRGVCCFPGC